MHTTSRFQPGEIFPFVMLFVTGLSLFSCTPDTGNAGGHRADTPSLKVGNEAARLQNGKRSPDELIGSALTAFTAGDTATLEALLITHDEFDRIIYPKLGIHYPAARDMRPETRSFLWENQMMNSSQGLRRSLRDLTGRKMKLLSIAYGEGGKKYESYSIYEGTVARVEMEDGRVADIHAFGSVVELNGVYKLLTYRQK